ncbi:MAG: aminotransferase class V-fold PLP-dependent enzyme [Clostridiales bacterium]|nr:aminotransferase class V-fold PLP-dependent enzyme [Clostridiales bacterium]
MQYDNMPLFKSIKDYADSNVLPFHMPGHKRGRIYKKLGLGSLFENILKMDTTEVPGVDNLFCPVGPLLKAQKMAAESFGADHSFFLINGTTAGIYAMILSTTNPGDKIIIPRNAHRSAISASILGRLQPVYLLPEIDEQMGIAMGIKPETIEKALIRNPDAKAVLITSPTYYGACSDLKSIAGIVHKHGKVLLVDEAHGSHFVFHKDLPKSALASGADMTAQSTHKTLLSMTGSSMLHTKGERLDIEKVKFYLQLVQTTSPSHVMLASLDAARYIMDKYGYILLDECMKYSDMVRKEINQRTEFYCLSYEKIGENGIYDIDPLRLTVCVKEGGLTGNEANRILRDKYKIQVELSDINNIAAITTVADGEEDYNKFLDAICSLSESVHKKQTHIGYKELPKSLPKIAVKPYEAIHKGSEMVELSKSIGLISAEMVIPYPPGIPVIMPGEVIDRDIVDYLIQCKESGVRISGTIDSNLDRIKIIK